jgi:dihydropyrimidinase
MFIINGNILTGDGPCRADLELEGGRIKALHAPLDQVPNDSPCLDAAGHWLLPGGVDAHTHFGMPLGGGVCSLGWRESAEAALLGGTTTIVDFANPMPGESLAAAVARWQGMAEGKVLCDYGLHCTVVDTAPERLEEIPGLVRQGVPTFKGFLAYKDRLMLDAGQMARLMAAVRSAGGLLLVHAEDGEMNAVAQDVLLNAGRIGPRYHPLAHAEKSEIKAVAEVLELAVQTGCPLEIVHMSLARSVELLAEARARHPELTLLGEVCLHHLLADASLYESGHEPALAATCSPPLRKSESCLALREALVRGEFDLLSTDHCEFPLAVKLKQAGGGFHQVPNGCGGVGERLVHSYSRLVVLGRLEAHRWQELVAEQPARFMGLGGRKGKLAPGYDADIVVFDPEARYRWQPLGQSDVPGSLWAGQEVQGAVRDVFLRGRQVVAAGRLVLEQPGGVFLPRALGKEESGE